MKKTIILLIITALVILCGRDAFTQEYKVVKVTVNDKMGTCTHFSQGWDYEQILPMIQRSGLGWIRDDLNWKDVERKKGVYIIPKKTMNWIRAAHEHDLKLILILNGSNQLYKNPYDPDAYARFAGAVAKQLAGHADALEIMNEPANFGYTRYYGGHWNGVDSLGRTEAWVKNYVVLLNKAAAAIKAVNPSVKVLGLGSVAPVNFRQLAMGISKDVDAVTDHPYSFKTAPEIVPFSALPAIVKRDGIATADDKGTFHSQMVMYRDQSARHNGPQELWLTEFGYTIFQPAKKTLYSGFTPGAQAKYLQRRFIEGLGMGIDRMIQYDFKDDGIEPHEAEHHFGLVDTRLNPKPAFYAVQHVAEATAALVPDHQLKVEVYPVADRPDEYPIIWDGAKLAAPGTIPVYGFKDAEGKSVIAIWSAERADGDLSSRIAAISIKVTDQSVQHIEALNLMTGESKELEFKQKNGTISIASMTIEDHPVLLYLNK